MDRNGFNVIRVHRWKPDISFYGFRVMLFGIAHMAFLSLNTISVCAQDLNSAAGNYTNYRAAGIGLIIGGIAMAVLLFLWAKSKIK